MRARLLVLLVLAALPAPGGAAVTEKGATVRVDLGVDTNAGRVSGDVERETDALAYLFAAGHLALKADAHRLGLQAEAGAKRFAAVHAEDLLAGRLEAAWALERDGWRPLATLTYKDTWQRGVAPDADDDRPCAPPPGTDPDTYRCWRRDYRTGGVDAGVELDPTADLRLRLTAGLAAFQYKPDPEFTHWGPRAAASLAYRLGPRHRLGLFASGGLRTYPDGTSYDRVASAPDGPLIVVANPDRDRSERLVGGGASWTWRGPVLLTGTWTVLRSFEAGDALDVLRHRLELAAALHLTSRTTLLATGAVQWAVWPEGNALRNLQLIADESEQQNGLAVRVSHRLSSTFALVLKAQAYANELAGGDAVLPFRRQIVQAGVEVDL